MKKSPSSITPQVFAPVVLVGDSNPSTSAAVVALLANLGFSSETVSNGKDLLLALKGRSYAAVVLDCQLDVGGFAVCKQIRRDFSKTVPVIGLTDREIAGGDEKARAAGMDNFLEKPVQQDQLERALGEWIGDPISRFLAQQKLKAEQRVRDDADAEKRQRMNRIANSIAQDEVEVREEPAKKNDEKTPAATPALLAQQFTSKGS